MVAWAVFDLIALVIYGVAWLVLGVLGVLFAVTLALANRVTRAVLSLAETSGATERRMARLEAARPRIEMRLMRGPSVAPRWRDR